MSSPAGNIVRRHLPVWLLALCCVVARNPADALHHWLWAEDSSIFLDQARIGLWPIVWPHHGYLHLYARLVALFNTAFPLLFSPGIFAAGWLLACLGSLSVISDCLYRTGAKLPAALMLTALICLQPASPELFFCLTNAQWWLGLALIIYLATPQPEAPGKMVLLAIFAAGMSGPFALLSLPMLALRAWWRRDWRSHAPLYQVTLAAALLQSAFLCISPRDVGIGFGATDDHPADWLWSLWQGLSFGGGMAGPVFWCILLAAGGRAWLVRQHQPPHRERVVLPALAALTILASACISARHNPLELTPFGILGRYFFVPYALLMFAVVAGFKGRWHALLALSLLAACLTALPHPAPASVRENLQWPAYIRLAQARPGVMIPINPLQGHIQGWHILADGMVQPHYQPDLAQSLAMVRVEGAAHRLTSGGLMIEPTGAAPRLYVDMGRQCGNDRYIGVIVGIERINGGYSTLWWSAGPDFTPGHTLRAFYGAGATTMQFAFERQPGEHLLRLDPNADNASPGNSRLFSLRLSCLGS